MRPIATKSSLSVPPAAGVAPRRRRRRRRRPPSRSISAAHGGGGGGGGGGAGSVAAPTQPPASRSIQAAASETRHARHRRRARSRAASPDVKSDQRPPPHAAGGGGLEDRRLAARGAQVARPADLALARLQSASRAGRRGGTRSAARRAENLRMTAAAKRGVLGRRQGRSRPSTRAPSSLSGVARERRGGAALQRRRAIAERAAEGERASSRSTAPWRAPPRSARARSGQASAQVRASRRRRRAFSLTSRARARARPRSGTPTDAPRRRRRAPPPRRRSRRRSSARSRKPLYACRNDPLAEPRACRAVGDPRPSEATSRRCQLTGGTSRPSRAPPRSSGSRRGASASTDAQARAAWASRPSAKFFQSACKPSIAVEVDGARLESAEGHTATDSARRQRTAACSSSAGRGCPDSRDQRFTRERAPASGGWTPGHVRASRVLGRRGCAHVLRSFLQR